MLLFFSALLCNVMNTLLQHYFSLFNPSQQPYLSVFSVHVSGGVCNTHMQLHTCHNPHRIRITPASHQWTYCLNYNQNKCTYGCARPPPPSSSLLSVRSRFFISGSLYCLVFAKLLASKCRFISSFPQFLNSWHISNERKNVPFKIPSKMSLLSLTDLSLLKGHKLVLKACQSRMNGFT